MEHNPFVALLLITFLAFIVPLLANRLRSIRLPIVVGEIIAGILIGKSGLNLIEPSIILTFLAEFGFVFLMFLSGLELDFDLMLASTHRRSEKGRWKQPMQLGALILLGTLLLAFLGALGLKKYGVIENPVLMALILSTTSLGVVVPVLKERDLLGSTFGQYMLGAASIADFATLILVTIAIGVSSHGLTLDLLLIPLLLLLFLFAVRAVRRYSIFRRFDRIMDQISSATSQLRMRGAFALMVAWVVLAEASGVEVILGAFLAGAIAGLISRSADSIAREKLDAIGYGFFVPIFFIMVGVEFNLQALFDSPRALLLVPALILLAILVKLIPGMLLRARFSWRETLAGGFLLSSRLSLIIAAAAIALTLGAIDTAVNSAIILLAVISCTFAPILFHRLFPQEEETRREGVILVGMDQMTELIAERMSEQGEPVFVLCPDADRVPAFQAMKNIQLVSGCTDYVSSLQQAQAERARALVDLTATLEETLTICRAARLDFGIPLVVSLISEIDALPELHQLGVRVVQPTLATAMALEGALRYPLAFDVLGQQTEEIGVGEEVLGNAFIAGLPLSKVRLPGDTMVLSVQRGDNVMVPQGDTPLQLHDRLGLIGSPQALCEARVYLRGG